MVFLEDSLSIFQTRPRRKNITFVYMQGNRARIKHRDRRWRRGRRTVQQQQRRRRMNRPRGARSCSRGKSSVTRQCDTAGFAQTRTVRAVCGSPRPRPFCCSAPLVFSLSRDRTNLSRRDGARPSIKSREWIQNKKERQRKQGKDVVHDSKYTGRKRGPKF